MKVYSFLSTEIMNGQVENREPKTVNPTSNIPACRRAGNFEHRIESCWLSKQLLMINC